MKLRLARNKDGNQVISLIKRCFKDYKNCYLDADNDSPELRYIYSYYKNKKRKIVLWTDTRFKEAHKMYKKLNYKKMSKTRKLNDISNTTEYSFHKVIN